MKLEIFDTKAFVDINDLKPITSPIIFQRGGVPDPNGLLSNEIFGVNTKSRKTQFAYIDLGTHFFHPHVYKVFKRVFRNIERIIAGSEYYSIDEQGRLIKDDENGDTGLNFLYKNWDKIKWERTVTESVMRKERLDLLTKSPKNEIFTKYQIVIPVFYRDVRQSDKTAETDPLNTLYSKIIRMVSLLNSKDMFDFTFNSTNFSIQNMMVEIYDVFKHKLERKNGMIRKYLMGKNVENCVRTVISNPLYHDNTPEDTLSKFGVIGTPLSQVCSLAYPFMQMWLKQFFEREYILQQEMKTVFVVNANGEKHVEQRKLFKPELYFTDKFIKKMVDRFIKDPESRFLPVEVPIDKGVTAPIAFTGKKMDPSGTHELSTIRDRFMTVTDLLYIAATEVIKGKHILVTRYPVSDAYGLFIGVPSVVTTIRTEVVQINGTIYKHYPRVEPYLDRAKIPIRFIDSMQFSNSYLAGIGGDYDGDQITAKLIWSMEANAECARVINSKSFFLTPSGKNARPIKYEVPQTMYDITKDPISGKNKTLLPAFVQQLIDKPSKEYTFDFLVDLFAYRKNGKAIQERRFSPSDIVHLQPNQFHNKEKIKTTVGRLVWNKIMIDRIDPALWKYFEYQNEVFTKSKFNQFESEMTLLLREDKIDTATFRSYLDHRDWLGLQLHSIVTVSFTEKTVKTPKEVIQLRDELFKKYEKELAEGDILTANKIEKELVQKMIECLGDDPGVDLYKSGARGDFNNHMKNLFIMRGGVMNPATGKYEIMKTAFNEGLRKEDFTAASNSVTQGAYPKAVGTADSGYLAKQLMAGMQTEVIDDDDTDCGTETTLEITITKRNEKELQRRYIRVGNNRVFLDTNTIQKYIGKKVNLYSPMCCSRTKNGKICGKCGGRQESKFVGLDSNKIGTILTNLNMKKFHDSTLRFNQLDVDDFLIGLKGSTIFKDDGKYFVPNTIFEVYIPMDFYEVKLVEDLGGVINLFSLVPAGVFKGDKLDRFVTINVPCWNKFNLYTSENRIVNIPGLGETPCKVLRYLPGQQMCESTLLEDSINAQMFLRQITYGKVPPTIPFKEALNVWVKNQNLTNVDYDVPFVILEVVLACCYRYKKNPVKKFSEVYGKNPDIDQYDYEMAGIRRICQLTSTFTGITFESFDDMATTSINRARDKGEETESPLEMLFKL